MEYDSPLTKGQQLTLVLTMAFSALFSIVGSMAVARIASRKLSSTYHRFMFMLSLADIINSAFLMFHQLMVPSNPEFYWALGNASTCSLAGFVLHFGGLSVAMFNCFLSIYFYCSIASFPIREKQPEHIIGLWEWLAHISSVAIPASIAGAAVGTGNVDLDDSLGLCAIHSYECINQTVRSDCPDPGPDGVSYPRDNNILFWSWMGTLLVVSCIGIIVTVLVYVKVRVTLTRAGRHSFEGATSDSTKKRLQAVSTQAVLYTLVFFLSFSIPFLNSFTPTSVAPLFSLHVLFFIFFPIQGVLNCLIYIRPRYMRFRELHPDDSKLAILRVCLSSAPTT